MLTARSFITCEWDAAVMEARFDTEAAEDYDEDPSSQQRPNTKKQVLQLRECLEVFTSLEKLGADDAWLVRCCFPPSRCCLQLLVVGQRARQDSRHALCNTFSCRFQVLPYLQEASAGH